MQVRVQMRLFPEEAAAYKVANEQLCHNEVFQHNLHPCKHLLTAHVGVIVHTLRWLLELSCSTEQKFDRRNGSMPVSCRTC